MAKLTRRVCEQLKLIEFGMHLIECNNPGHILITQLYSKLRRKKTNKQLYLSFAVPHKGLVAQFHHLTDKLHVSYTHDRVSSR